MPTFDDRHLVSVTWSGDPKLAADVAEAFREVLGRFGESPDFRANPIARWEQEGGWFQVVTPDPWSQEGGWVLDLEGRVTRCDGRPAALIARDVWAVLDQVKDMRPDPNWEQSWGPIDPPKPGPCPGGPVG